MKQLYLLAICMFCMLSFSTAQVTYEASYVGPNSTASARLQLINIGNSEFKFAVVDYSTNEIRLYNLNHTLFSATTVPVTMVEPGQYNVGYISRSLFDCDTSAIEYALMPGDPNKAFYVYRLDGTLLFQKDSTIAPYCYGCFNGSYDQKPIVNTPTGAKLFLHKNHPVSGFLTTDVYSLCGKLPDGMMELNSEQVSMVKVYPNPSAGEVNFEFSLPDNVHDYEMVILNTAGQPIHTTPIKPLTKSYKFSDAVFESGMYYFSLIRENKIVQSGKFIIAR